MKMCKKGLHQHSAARCRECQYTWRRTNSDKTKDTKLRYRTAHPEKEKAYNKAYAEKRRVKTAYGRSGRAPSWYMKNRATELMARGGKRYGIPAEEYATRIAQPCGICGHIEKRRTMHVDHDHETGKLRGTLCHDCNIGLGVFDDSSPRLISAVHYLMRYA